MLTILIALQVAQVQVAQPPVAKVASPDAVTRLQAPPRATPIRPQSKQQALANGRDLLAQAETVHAKATDPAAKAELEAKMAELKTEMDSLSDMSEEMSLKLQMFEDRMAKAMEAVSNMMKKMSETQSSIIQNMK